MSEKFSLPWYALLFPLSQLVLLWRLTMQILATGHINPWGLVAAALFLLCVGTDILLFKTLRQSTQHEISVKRQQLMEHSLAAQRQRGEALRQEAEQAAGIRLELTARLEKAAELLHRRQWEDTCRCMDSAAELYPTPERYCAHPVADAILTEKLALCQKENIPVDCRLQIPANLPLSGAELCAVLANLLDNAMAACRTLPQEKRQIEIWGRVTGGFLLLRFCNPLPEPAPQPTGGERLDRHGWGLSIVRQIAERHAGRLTAEGDKTQFVATVWISTAEPNP